MHLHGRRRERGYGALWVFVLLALMAVGVAGLLIAEDTKNKSAPFWILGVCLPLMALVLWIEVRRDDFTAAKWVGFYSLATSVVTGLAVLNGGPGHPIAGATALLTMIVATGCGVYVFRTQRAKEILPNVLRNTFGAAAIREVMGVQFVAQPGTVTVSSGGAFDVEVLAQNCWDAQRTFTVKLKPEVRISFNRKRILVPNDASITLEGGEVGKLVIHCIAESGASGDHLVRVLPNTSGSAGIRVRKWRAAEVTSQIPAWVTLVGPLLGFIAWGGGMKIRVAVQPAQVPGPESGEPSHKTETLWRPG